jgi:hypothetical protein
MSVNWLREIWKSRPPVSPWWMYRWLRDWAPRRGRLRAALHTFPCWWTLWRWAASPEGYEDVILGVTSVGARPQRTQ